MDIELYLIGLFEDPEPGAGGGTGGDTPAAGGDDTPAAGDDTPTEEEDYIIRSSDVEPAISYDHINRINGGIKKLMEILGVTNLREIQNGAAIKLYKTTVVNTPEQVDEGEVVPLTQIKRTCVKTISIPLNKFRKQVTAEAIQRDGYENAINATDNKFAAMIRKNVKDTFFSTLAEGSGTATPGADLQQALANALAGLKKATEDEDVTPVAIVHWDDLYGYLGAAEITTQSEFGFDYLSNFLGRFSYAIFTGDENFAGKPTVTCQENIHGVKPGNGSDVARALGYSTDVSGTVLMKHVDGGANFSLETRGMCGVAFYAEDLDLVFVGAIGE